MGGAIYRPVADVEDRLERLQSAIAGTAFDWLALHFTTERMVHSARQSMNARRDRFLNDAKAAAGYPVTVIFPSASTAGPLSTRRTTGSPLLAVALSGWGTLRARISWVEPSQARVCG